MTTLQLKIPALGESITEATVGKWKRAEGEAVKGDEPLVEVESDKATLEVPSPGTGVLKKILHQSGATVRVGDVIAEIDTSAAPVASPVPIAPTAEAISPAPANKPAPGPAPITPPPGQTPAAKPVSKTEGTVNGVGPTSGDGVKASPALRRMMAEKGLNPDDVLASGPAGRIEQSDIERALAAKQSAPQGGSAPAPVAAKPTIPGPNERVVPMTPLRRTVARRLLEAQNTAAILTTFNEINMAEVMSLRERFQEQFQKRHGIKLGFMSFFVKAAVDALKAFPIVNAEVRGNDILYKDHFDIGVAVGGGKGLVVPVVRNADRLSLAEVERTIAELGVKARENRITLQDLEGGTFTISNGGIYGSMMSTPILNPPQSGILGLHAIQKRPVAVGEAIALRPMMYVALSYDHRIVDGREAVQFLVRIKECIEDPERILIEV
ncbi:MAG TPA: 2-oxoglutarate dehydrogenase complex dihydrolipoyllysine-residue succinyltransferase [Polyangia bacterium]